MKLDGADIREFFTNNYGMKGLAILLACLSFYAIRGMTGFEISYDIPLEVVVAKGIAVLEKETRTLRVTFRGSPDDLRRLEQARIKAVVRPKEAVLSGSERVPVGPRNIEGAPGVTVTKIEPSAVTLTFDREDKKEVVVETPRTTGTPLIGRAELEFQPDRAVVRGPRLRLFDLDSVSTEPVDVDGRVQSFTKTVRILAPSDKWALQIEPSEVTVSVKIVTELISRTWTNVPVLAVVEPGAAVAFAFDPPTVNVTLEGRPEKIDDIAAGALRAFGTFAGANLSATSEVPVIVPLPAGSDVTVRVTPKTVRIVQGEAP